MNLSKRLCALLPDARRYLIRVLQEGALVMMFVSRDMYRIVKDFRDTYGHIIIFNLCVYGAVHGNQDLIALGITCGHPTDSIVHTAIIHQQFKTAEWCLERFFPWDRKHACLFFAANGFLPMLEFAHAHGCKWNDNYCGLVAQNGHVDVLKWAHDLNPKNMTKFDAISACTVMSQQIEVLKWVIETGYVLKEYIYHDALHHSPQVLIWLSRNDPNWNKMFRRMTIECIEPNNSMDY